MKLPEGQATSSILVISWSKRLPI